MLPSTHLNVENPIKMLILWLGWALYSSDEKVRERCRANEVEAKERQSRNDLKITAERKRDREKKERWGTGAIWSIWGWQNVVECIESLFISCFEFPFQWIEDGWFHKINENSIFDWLNPISRKYYHSIETTANSTTVSIVIVTLILILIFSLFVPCACVCACVLAQAYTAFSLSVFDCCCVCRSNVFIKYLCAIEKF